MNKPLPFFTLVLCLLVQLAWGQNRIVAGRLTDKDQQPLPGVNILIKGSSTGTSTDANGNYRLIAPLGSTLVISFIGFSNREVKVTEKNSLPADHSPAKQTLAAANLPAPLADTLRLAKKKARHPLTGGKRQSGQKLPEGEVTLTDDAPSFVMANSPRQETPLTYFPPVYEIRFRQPRRGEGKSGAAGERGLFVLEGPDSRRLNSKLRVNYATSFTLDQANRLPALQREYAQGRPIGGREQWQGPQTGELFSWGPRIRNLEFDGQPEAFDKNGALLPRGQGNGRPAQTYQPLSFFKTGHSLDHSLSLTAKVRGTDLHANYGHKLQSGLYPGSGLSRHNLTLKARSEPVPRLKLAYLGAYADSRSQLPGRGAAYANLLTALYLAPPSFDQANGLSRRQAAANPGAYLQASGSQRSFSPGQADNPYWLVNTMPDAARLQTFVSNYSLKYSFHDRFSLDHSLGLNNQRQNQEMGLALTAAAAPQGRYSFREEKQNQLHAHLKGQFRHQDKGFNLETGLSYDFNRERRQLNRAHASGYEASGNWELPPAGEQDALLADKVRHRHEAAAFAYLKFNDLVNLRLTNSTYASNTLARPVFFLPAAGLSLNVHSLEPLRQIDHILSAARLFASFSRSLQEAPLIYSSRHYNTLALPASEYAAYYEKEDLVYRNNLKAEQIGKFETGLDADFLYGKFNLVASYFHNKTTKAILPVLSDAGFALQNVADLKNKGLELQLSYFHRGQVWIRPGLNLLVARPTVTRLHGRQAPLPLAGFRDISTNLVAGAPYGLLYGSRYLRNEAGQVLIGPEGFPLTDPNPGPIGNPNPAFTAGFHNTITWKKLSLYFVFDFRKGGDVWNGTRSVLNYYGASRETQQARSTRQHLFEGVHPDGSPNTLPVDFANPANGLAGNRWVRYGLTGVAEEAIEEASWIRLNEVKISYPLHRLSQKLITGSQATLSLMGRNLWLLSSYQGTDPASSLFGYEEARGLDLFNAPGTRSYGMALQVNF